MPQVGTDGQSAILRRLLALRLALLVAIMAGVAFVHWGLAGGVGLGTVGVALAVLLVHSGFMIVRSRRMAQLREFDLLSFLVVDAAALLLVVGETGLTANPFIYYLLVLIAVGASVLSLRTCALFTLGCCVAYTALMLSDVRGHFDHRDSDYQLHLLGMWVNFVGSAVLISLALARLTRALREREAALAGIREDNLRNEQLVGIGTLAASTVHALGTPLSTLSVLLGDMKDTLSDPASKEDVALMLEQIDRCRLTMQKLSLLAESEQVDQQSVSVEELAAMIKEHYSLPIPTVAPQFNIVHGFAEGRLRYDLLLKHALINLIDNAIQAAAKAVEVAFECQKDSLFISIENDGSRLPEHVLVRWGKPVVSSKRGGLGIGVFLANSSVERLGGTVSVRQTSFEGKRRRTVVVIRLPLIDGRSPACH